MGLIKGVHLPLHLPAKQNSPGSTNFTAPVNSYWELELARIASNFVKTALNSALQDGYNIYDQ